MARYVTSDVKEVRDDPDSDGVARVAIVVEGGASTIEERVEAHSGDLDRELPSGVVIAEIPEPKLASFCSTDLIDSVSLADRMRTLS